MTIQRLSFLLTLALILLAGVHAQPLDLPADADTLTTTVDQSIVSSGTIMQPSITPTRPFRIFNGKDFSRWRFFLKDSTVDPGTVWSVKDGVIHCAGKPDGYLRSMHSFKNYMLTLEYRWIGKPGNSGVFVNVQREDKLWPMAQEIQLKSSELGDIRLNGGSSCMEKDQARPGKTDPNQVPRLTPPREKPVGEWNTLEVKVFAGRILVDVNGQMASIVSGTVPEEGAVALQSEGGEIEFRNLTVAPVGQ